MPVDGREVIRHLLSGVFRDAQIFQFLPLAVFAKHFRVVEVFERSLSCLLLALGVS